MMKKVWVYNDKGVSAESFCHLVRMLRHVLSNTHVVESIDAWMMRRKAWMQEGELLAFPGGADVPYTKMLNGLGNQRIREFVEQGGKFLGICAGAYYGGNFVDFASGTDMAVQEKRELGFFPGTVRGPLLASYDSKLSVGVRAETIQWIDKTPYTVYYNGGGYFVDAERKDGVSVLATYSLGEEYPAIIECTVGEGKVLLSGVHFEYEPNSLDPKDPYLPRIAELLQKNERKRLCLTQEICARLVGVVSSKVSV